MTAPRRSHVTRVVEDIAVLARAFSARSGRPFGELTLNGRHLDVLFALARAGQRSMSQLAEAAGVTRGAMTQTIEPLRASGLVEVAPDPDDGRGRVVALTAQARERIAEFERDYVDAVAHAFDGLDDDEVARLAELLDRLRRYS
jgi:DNA-binding MarR family transcriptional regulator